MIDNFKQSRYEILILLFISTIIFCKAIGMESENLIYIFLYAVGTVLVALKFLFESHSKRELLILSLGILIGVLDLIIGKSTTFLFTVIVLAGLKNLNIKKFFYIAFYIRFISLILIVFLSTENIIPNHYLIFYRNGLGYVKRYSFIFVHPNIAQSAFVICAIIGIYLYYHKYNIIYFVIIEGLNYFLYKLTYSRTGFLLLSIFLLFTLIYKKSNLIRKFMAFIIPYLPIFYLIISIIAGVEYGRLPLLNKLNVILTGRIYYINYLLKFKPPLIGSSKYTQFLFIDNGYMSLLYEGGLLALCWFSIVSFKTLKILKKNLLYKDILITFVFLTYCLTESYYMNILMNCSVVFFSYYIYGYKN